MTDYNDAQIVVVCMTAEMDLLDDDDDVAISHVN